MTHNNLNTHYSLEELLEKYKKHAYDGEVEQTIEYIQALITTAENKARVDELQKINWNAATHQCHNLRKVKVSIKDRITELERRGE